MGVLGRLAQLREPLGLRLIVAMMPNPSLERTANGGRVLRLHSVCGAAVYGLSDRTLGPIINPAVARAPVARTRLVVVHARPVRRATVTAAFTRFIAIARVVVVAAKWAGFVIFPAIVGHGLTLAQPDQCRRVALRHLNVPVAPASARLARTLELYKIDTCVPRNRSGDHHGIFKPPYLFPHPICVLAAPRCPRCCHSASRSPRGSRSCARRPNTPIEPSPNSMGRWRRLGSSVVSHAWSRAVGSGS